MYRAYHLHNGQDRLYVKNKRHGRGLISVEHVANIEINSSRKACMIAKKHC